MVGCTFIIPPVFLSLFYPPPPGSGPLPEEVTYSQTTPYPYKVPQYSPQNSMDMSYIRIEEGHPRYNPPAPNPAPAGHSGMRMVGYACS